MSNKLLPPQVAATLPAFAGTKLIVPAKMNKAVSSNEIKGFKCRIKTAIDNEQKNIIDSEIYSINGQDIKVEFDIAKLNLQAGQFYKIQLAYFNNEDTGFFSTVGIIKYCKPIDIFISSKNALDNNMINQETGSYLGNYITEDPSEKLYQFKFDILNENREIIDTTGWQLHNTTMDTSSTEVNDIFIPSYNFISNKMYYIQFSVITINKLERTKKYKIMRYDSLSSDLHCNLQAYADNENAKIDIYIQSLQEEELSSITGAFVLSKLDTIHNKWQDIYYFSLFNENPFKKIFTDYIVEQNVEYIYSIRQYNDNNFYSNRILSNSIKVDFENIYLFDGEKQLVIKFNPKVSSFKNSVLEQKIVTLGNKHPYIFKNGCVNYKEFPISGLLSYKIDSNYDFINLNKQEELNFYDMNLDDKNTFLERQFKLSVLNWLTDGKVKLFKSPTEGNYLVRLLNVNLTPNDTLGRMIHNFSCNAVEVEEYSYNNLITTNIIPQENVQPRYNIASQWVTIPLMEINQETGQAIYKSNQTIEFNNIVHSLDIQDMSPGDKIIIYCNNEMGDIVPIEIIIGSTGGYHIDNVDIYKIKIPEQAKYTGSITYKSENVISNSFALIEYSQMKVIPCRQFFGYNYTGNNNLSSNLLLNINNIKDNINAIYKLTFSKLSFDKKDSLPWDDVPNNFIQNDFSYQIKIIYNKGQIDKNGNSLEIETLLDLKDINNLYEYNISKTSIPDAIYVGNGIQCDISYSIIRAYYSVEKKLNISDNIIIPPEDLEKLAKELKKYKEEHGIG